MTTRYDDFFKLYAAMFFDDLVAWPWFKAQAMAESNLRVDAVSPAGAQGLMQLMPATAAEMARLLYLDPPDLCNPRTNILLGIAYSKRMWDVWKAEEGLERLCFAFASYNAGMGNILKAQSLADVSDQWASLVKVLPRVTGHHAQETITYIQRIKRYRLAMIES